MNNFYTTTFTLALLIIGSEAIRLGNGSQFGFKMPKLPSLPKITMPEIPTDLSSLTATAGLEIPAVPDLNSLTAAAGLEIPAVPGLDSLTTAAGLAIPETANLTTTTDQAAVNNAVA